MVKVCRFNKLNLNRKSIKPSISIEKIIDRIRSLGNQYFFVPIYKNNKELLIQTTKIFIPFGLTSYTNSNSKCKYSLIISINNKLLEFIKEIDNTFKNMVIYKKKMIANYIESATADENGYPPLLNLKVPTIDNKPYISIFNHNKEHLTYKHIIPGSYGICIIQPAGLWFKIDEELGIYNCKCIWNLLQIKLYLPFYMTTNGSASCYIEDSDDEDMINNNDNIIDLKELKKNKIEKNVECICPNCDYQFNNEILYSIKNIQFK